MDNVVALVDRYIETWNETNAAARAPLVARTWTEGARYRDPALEGDGHAGIDTMIAAVHARFPGHRFRRTSDVDHHHDVVRFAWELAPADGAPIVRGIDVGTVSNDDRLASVTGFFDAMPAANA